MMRALLLSVLLFLPSPLWATWTTAEVTSIQGLNSGLGEIEEAYGNVATLVLSVNTTDNGYTSDIWENMNTALAEVGKGIGYLNNIHPTSEGTSCGASRAACVASANTHFNNAITSITAARAVATTCKTSGSASYYRSACTSVETDLGQALTALGTTYDDTLTYTSPNSSWYPHVFGPHGDFDAAMFQAVQFFVVMAAGLDEFRAGWDWVTNGETVWTSIGSTSKSCTPQSTNQVCSYARLVDVIAGLVVQKVRITTMAVMGIPGTDASPAIQTPQYQLRPNQSFLSLIANMYEFVLRPTSESTSRNRVSGLPYHYSVTAGLTLSYLNEAMVTRPICRGHFQTGWKQMTVDAWFHSDGFTWKTFEFPSDAALLALRAAKNPLNDPHGPPVTVAR